MRVRDAALFTYGIGIALGQAVYFARTEQEDYDFVASWVIGDERHYCPVQHKEIPPEDLNRSATITSTLAALRPYGKTRTVLAVNSTEKAA